MDSDFIMQEASILGIQEAFMKNQINSGRLFKNTWSELVGLTQANYIMPGCMHMTLSDGSLAMVVLNRTEQGRYLSGWKEKRLILPYLRIPL